MGCGAPELIESFEWEPPESISSQVPKIGVVCEIGSYFGGVA